MRARFICCVVAACLGAARTSAQDIDLSFLPTRAEATGYEETTSYQEVMAILDVLAAASDRVFVTHFGYSSEGRALPLAVFGNVDDASPEAVRASGKTRVFIQANIHAGEVCGKEAALILLRALASGQHAAWADSLIILVAPIYNADGNERLGLENRPLQHGPVGGMGQRPNAQGYDLNRDHMKLDAPEARSLVRFLRRYDPHVVVDLHTTDGSFHAYHLTYSPPLNPNTPAPIDSLLRQHWLPVVTEAIKAKYGWDYYYYGNLPDLDEGYFGTPGAQEVARGWYTFDHRPRFNNNYVGLRNRFAILSEAYAYATFEERVLATLYFLEEILAYAHDHASTIQAITEAADNQAVAGQSLAVRARLQPSPAPVEILLGEVVEEKNPYSGAVMLRRQDVRRPERMLEYGRFVPEETAVAPQAYAVPAALATVVDRLEAHGIAYTVLEADRAVQAERFRIDSASVAQEAFQGHRPRTLFGSYEATQTTLPAGTRVVSLDQPLGRLAFYLLEPRSDDGVATWGLLDDAQADTLYYPILRLPAAP